MKRTLLSRFALSLSLLGVVLTVETALFSYYNSKNYLEDMYAHRVISGSKSVASMMQTADVRSIISDSGNHSGAYIRTVTLLNTLKQDGDVTFLSLVVPNENSVTFYVDAMVEAMGDDPAEQIPYGTDILYTDAARDNEDLQNYELMWELYSHGKGTDTPFITDNSYGYNYTSVSPILDEDGNAIAAIQYILDMQEVRGHLNSFLRTMLSLSFSSVAIAMLVYVLFVRRVVTIPIGKLAAFTKGITDSGRFENQRIEIKTNDEIEDLGKSFNYMLIKLEDYIANLQVVTAEKERIGAELDVAKKIQADMLPSIFPPFPLYYEFDIYASMQPAKEVGGDFYDFFLVNENTLGVVVADVSGKGVPAALFMVVAKTLIQNTAISGKCPEDVFRIVNKMLCDNNDSGMFVTAFLGYLDISTGNFTFVNAGHNPPLWKKANESFEWLKARAGFVLAGDVDTVYKQNEITLNPGDELFLYTDGVTEAVNNEKELFSDPRLLEVANKLTADSQHQPSLQEFTLSVKHEIDDFAEGAEQADDITMLALRYKGRQSDMKELIIEAKIENLDTVLDFISAELENTDCPMKLRRQIAVAVEEVFVNIAHYAYNPEIGGAVIRVAVGKEIIIEFEDRGKPYNPLEKPDPDITLSADEREIGGLGIFMVKNIADTVEYRHEDGKNILVLRVVNN